MKLLRTFIEDHNYLSYFRQGGYYLATSAAHRLDDLSILFARPYDYILVALSGGHMAFVQRRIIAIASLFDISRRALIYSFTQSAEFTASSPQRPSSFLLSFLPSVTTVLDSYTSSWHGLVLLYRVTPEKQSGCTGAFRKILISFVTQQSTILTLDIHHLKNIERLSCLVKIRTDCSSKRAYFRDDFWWIDQGAIL